ncbi:MAG TPA: tetratricopeptide repeat protein [Pyrinomonadaceae bacterium]|jgi:tetratricopeptide (TPR) repeat protein
MSDPIVKGAKRSPSRPTSRQNSPASSAKNRAVAGKSTPPKPLVKRSASDKAPARKATKSNTKAGQTAASKSNSARPKATKSAPPQKPVARKTAAKPAAAQPAKAKTTARPPAPVKSSAQKAPAAAAKSRPAQPKPARPLGAARPPTTPPPPRQPTQDEAAALRAFERAHKEFARGHFAEARAQFRVLIEKHGGVSEVTARARTYLAIAEARLRTESSLPRDADSLYDRGVIELNRGEYVAAQEMFERALKREPQAAHIHYGLAATRSRLGAIDVALESLKRALDLQPNLRLRAQSDLDLIALRTDPEFERLVFASRF